MGQANAPKCPSCGQPQKVGCGCYSGLGGCGSRQNVDYEYTYEWTDKSEASVPPSGKDVCQQLPAMHVNGHREHSAAWKCISSQCCHPDRVPFETSAPEVADEAEEVKSDWNSSLNGSVPGEDKMPISGRSRSRIDEEPLDLEETARHKAKTSADKTEREETVDSLFVEQTPTNQLFQQKLTAETVDTAHPNHREIHMDSGRYVGQVDLATDTFNGFGWFESRSETVSLGYWTNGRLHGEGKQTWLDGRSYLGSFQHGVFSGHGTMRWKTKRGQMVYDGEYSNDKRHGEGKFTWPSGKSYSGQWVNGQRHGTGIDTTASGRQWRSVWEADVLIESDEPASSSVP